jgi:hypothetical protein
MMNPARTRKFWQSPHVTFRLGSTRTNLEQHRLNFGHDAKSYIQFAILSR